ncbi:pilus assembly protein CpaC [Sphingomonas sp. BE270]|jgi:pilus assembly protein CpaC|uniref:type II and III secretion system protein family protein n=1 Tax=unclassified Sphingomonas TaxID=196159 RepID=UPI00053E60B1|nr:MULTISPECIES: type II and III secretion system protein family protein [unclassified Sphingomonas]MDR6847493.1 pilus assembly protein CpaC [Sphingomonas sp. BE137]MDR7257036.1 pilus assembly protein CpaC [Sphingomonas sp. BE270]
MRSATALHRVLSATVITALVGSAPVTAMAAGPKLQAKPAPARGGQRPVTHVGAAPAGTVRPTTEVVLSTGQGELINLPANVSDVWVSNPGVADVYVNNLHQIHLFGKDSGESTIFATSASGTVIYAANIRVSQNLSSIDRMVKLAMPDSDIKVTTVGQIAVLTGTVSSPEDSAAAQRLVTALLNPGVAVGPDAALKVGVINRLRAATPLQVNLQVRIAEVSRSFVKNIGVNLTSRGSGSTLFGITQGRQGTIATAPGTIGSGIINADGSLPGQTVFTQPAATGMGTTLGLAGHALGMDLLSSLDLGERDGQVSTLANPNITVISGETGSFLAGGEFPIPISQGLGAVSVDYKQYGVSLSYTPTVLADGRISLHVRPEVSQLSSQGSVTLSGVSIPALTTRRAETTVELGSGQSMMIAGLLQNNHNNSIDKAPALGDMPIVGALFRSNAFQRNETELVIVITPYLVKPVNANDIVLPTDGYKAPTDLGRVFMGQLGGGTTGGDRPKPTMAPAGSAQPSLGAAAPGPVAPDPTPGSPVDRRRDAPAAITPPPSQTKKGASAAPGFDIN